MRKITYMAIVCLTLAVFSVAATAGGETKPGEKIIATVKLQLEVVQIDHGTRDVVLKGPAGNLLEVTADERVRHLDKVKVGDVVDVTIIKSFAIFVQKSGSGMGEASIKEVTVIPDGNEPGRLTIGTVEESAYVEKIDYKKRMVTLKDATGQSFELDVPQDVENLDKVKVGDELVVRYTEAVAVSLSKHQ